MPLQPHEVTEYVRGTNERLDVMLEEDEQVFIVNGSIGRISISAGSKQDAINIYMKKVKK